MEHAGHHEEGHDHAPDPLGKRVAVMAATFAVLLAVVTILSHRAHTAAVMEKSEENDKWNEYQSKKLKMHTREVGADLMTVLGEKNPLAGEKIKAYNEEIGKYKEEAANLMKEAKEKGASVKHVEKQAAYFDIGEGLLELGLIMSSLYFIGKKALFPIVGFLSGIGGVVLGVIGLML